MSIYFNPLDTACKNIIGAVRQSERIQFNVFSLRYEVRNTATNFRITHEKDCISPNSDAFLHLNRDGEEHESILMEKTPFGWSVSIQIAQTGLYYYSFYIPNVGYVSCGHGQIGEITTSPKGFLLTVYAEEYKTPEWFKGGVMYQIFPDRFYKQGAMPDIKGRVPRVWGEEPYFRPNECGKVLNNDFFGGNFKGIESKVPYLSKLGVTVIYLNPVFKAASNHRYDTSDYMQIDPILGTEDDFSSLISAANGYGIKIILDGVFNHTGDDSVYFNKYGNYPSLGAYQSQKSPYYSWYSFKKFPDKYESWWGIDILPEINENSPSYQEFIFGKEGVLKKWLGFGIGGYRLDVADELPDFFLKNLRKSVKESEPNAIIIGEVWEDATDKIAYSKRKEYLQGYELDSVMNYPLKNAIISYLKTENARTLLNTVLTLIDHYPKQTLDCLMNILGTHDTARILTVLGGIYCQNKEEMAKSTAYLNETQKKQAIEQLKMAVILQYTLPGIPCVYYGDENGLEGHIDPFCRRCFDWEHVNEDLLKFYQKLGNIRENYRRIFKDGIFEEIDTQDGLIFYKRTKINERIYVFVNNCSKTFSLDLKDEEYTELLENRTIKNKLNILPYSYGILIKS